MKIQRVLPIDNGKLVIEFDNGVLREFPNKVLNDTDVWFLGYFGKLQSYIEGVDRLSWLPIDKYEERNGKNIWSGEASLLASQLWDMSDALSQRDLAFKGLSLGMKNQAPTEQHLKHHVYFLYIAPFKTEEWLIFGESIGGGFGERGGALPLSRNALDEFENWENHCLLAGCDWIIPILKKINETDEQIMGEIISEYRRSRLNQS